jgi:hypothetical protein
VRPSERALRRPCGVPRRLPPRPLPRGGGAEWYSDENFQANTPTTQPTPSAAGGRLLGGKLLQIDAYTNRPTTFRPRGGTDWYSDENFHNNTPTTQPTPCNAGRRPHAGKPLQIDAYTNRPRVRDGGAADRIA